MKWAGGCGVSRPPVVLVGGGVFDNLLSFLVEDETDFNYFVVAVQFALSKQINVVIIDLKAVEERLQTDEREVEKALIKMQLDSGAECRLVFGCIGERLEVDCEGFKGVDLADEVGNDLAEFVNGLNFDLCCHDLWFLMVIEWTAASVQPSAVGNCARD